MDDERRDSASLPDRPRVLILCFDPISVDPRVIKQVRLLVQDYDVTTCSPGPVPHPDVTHVELVPGAAAGGSALVGKLAEVARRVGYFPLAYRRVPYVQQAAALLRTRTFDAIIANDAEPIGLALRLVGRERVHADLHEFFPGLAVSDDRLGRKQRRYRTWLIRRFAARARSSTTVATGIADRYRELGLDPQVVTNAAPFHELSPGPVEQPIRLVHSGNPFLARGITTTMRAVAAARVDVTLDLYLTYNPPTDREHIVALAAELGPRITVREPVSQDVLIDELHRYDVGIHVLPPTNENNALALPNKFFDFVQARLGVIVGPSPEMARILTQHGLGAVTADFGEDAIRTTLESLTPETVRGWKDASHAAASTLSAESESETWAWAIRGIVGR